MKCLKYRSLKFTQRKSLRSLSSICSVRRTTCRYLCLLTLNKIYYLHLLFSMLVESIPCYGIIHLPPPPPPNKPFFPPSTKMVSSYLFSIICQIRIEVLQNWISLLTLIKLFRCIACLHWIECLHVECVILAAVKSAAIKRSQVVKRVSNQVKKVFDVIECSNPSFECLLG